MGNYRAISEQMEGREGEMVGESKRCDSTRTLINHMSSRKVIERRE